MILSFAAVALQALCCLGIGAAVLRILDIVPTCRIEQFSWSFVLGLGLLGALLFPVGVAHGFKLAVLLPILCIGAASCLFLQPFRLSNRYQPLKLVDTALLAGLAVSACLDLAAAISPPADADTMAYHFALPKQFVSTGAIEFVPRALDGAIPLLMHLTYVPPLLLGSEEGLTLWTAVTMWAAIALIYAIARRWLDRSWCLAISLVLATTPAIFLGVNSGQVEPRLILFAALASIALSDAIRSSDCRYTLVAGLSVGFFMASKYTGLLFACACGLTLVVILMLRRGAWFRHGIILTITAIAIGSEWYFWNWINSGDPVFPLLFGSVDTPFGFWDAEHQQLLNEYQRYGERDIPINLLWLIAYPFVATLHGFPVFESGRTGFGPIALLLLPMAIIGAITSRRRILDSPLLPIAVVAMLFYILWFGSGVSQRIRHLLPVYPLVFVLLVIAAQRSIASINSLKAILAAFLLTWIVQATGQFVFARNYLHYILSNETRAAFLERNVWGYTVVEWINKNLGAEDRVLVPFRNLIYLFDVPTFYAHPTQEALVDVGPKANDPQRYLREIERQGITYVLAESAGRTGSPSGLNLWQTLASSGCLRPVKMFEVDMFQSRTLPELARSKATWELLKLDETACGDHG